MVIMDLWGMFYHPVVVRVRTFVLLLDLISAYCVVTYQDRIEYDKDQIFDLIPGTISHYSPVLSSLW